MTHQDHDTLRILPPVLCQLLVVFLCLFIIQGEQDIRSVGKAALCVWRWRRMDLLWLEKYI
jgi:hypothetical protein